MSFSATIFNNFTSIFRMAIFQTSSGWLYQCSGKALVQINSKDNKTKFLDVHLVLTYFKFIIFLYPLKRSENLWSLMFTGGTEKDIRLQWVNFKIGNTCSNSTIKALVLVFLSWIWKWYLPTDTAQKMKFPFKDFFSKCD